MPAYLTIRWLGLVMLVGTIVLLVGVAHAAGGLSQAAGHAARLRPQLVTPQGADDILSPADLFLGNNTGLFCVLARRIRRCAASPIKTVKAVHQHYYRYDCRGDFNNGMHCRRAGSCARGCFRI